MSARYDEVRTRLDAIGDQLSRGGLALAERYALFKERHQLEDEFVSLARDGLVASANLVTSFLQGEVWR